MNNRQSDNEPKVQLEASKGGSGGGKTAIGAGAGGDSDPESIIALAQEEPRRLGHNFIGTAELLIALIRCRSGFAPYILSELGLAVEDVRAEVESIVGRGSGSVAAEIPFTPRVKRALQLSWDEVHQLGHNYIESEHLLLGIVSEGDGVAARVLNSFNIDSALVRERVLLYSGSSGKAGTSQMRG